MVGLVQFRGLNMNRTYLNYFALVMKTTTQIHYHMINKKIFSLLYSVIWHRTACMKCVPEYDSFNLFPVVANFSQINWYSMAL